MHSQLLRSFLLLLSIVFCTSAFAQTTLTGTVADADGKPIVSGNALVFSLPDSALVTGQAFWDGKLELAFPQSTTGFLRVTALGMRDTSIALSSIDFSQPLAVVLLPAAMKEVTIAALKTAFKNEGDQLVVKVEESALSGSGTALDVLRNTPGVRVSGTSNVTVLGRGTPTLYLDGQLITADMLQSIASEDISEIEVIKNPGARYDAEGRAVINIITKASMQEGYHINLTSHSTRGRYWRTYNQVQGNYRKGKWNTTARYGLYRGDYWSSDEFWRDFERDGTRISMENEVIDREAGLGHYYGAAINYQADTLNRFGLYYRGFARTDETTIDNRNLVTTGSTKALITTNTNSSRQKGNHVVGLSHNLLLDTLRSNLNTTAEYSRFSSRLNDAIAEEVTAGQVSAANKRNLNRNYINILTARTDLEKNYLGDWRIEAGLKYSNIFNTSNIVFDRQDANNTWVNNPESSNDFDYDEKIGAAYVQAQKKFGKWVLRGGLRAETTQSYGFSNARNQVVVDTTYINLFPSAKVSLNITKDLAWHTTYNYRINRPSYQDLDPFLDYLDSVSAFQGNPQLIPELTHSVSTSLVFMEFASLDLEYARTQNSMNLFVERIEGENDRFIAQTRNFNFAEQYSAGIVLPYQTNKWTTYNGIGYQWNTFEYFAGNELVTISRPMWYFYLYDEITIPGWFTADAQLEYYGAGLEGMFDYETFWTVRASIHRKFFEDALDVRLTAEDIFGSYVERGKSFLPDYEIRYRNRYDRQLVRLTLRYNFGRLRNLEVQQSNAANEERNRIKQD